MKRLFATRTFFVCLLLCLFATHAGASGFLKNWVNTSGGSWFDPNNWSPSAVPTNGDAVTITNNGTYTVYAPTGYVTCGVFTIGGASGKQTFVYGSTVNVQLGLTNSTIQNHGVLIVTNGGLKGSLQVNAGGELDLSSQSGLFLYDFALTNQGSVTWSNGTVSLGGTIPAITYVTNSGQWLIAITNDAFYQSGGGYSFFFNTGTIQKTGGNAIATFSTELHNTGNVSVDSGTLVVVGAGTNFLGGAFTSTSPALMKFTGNQSDAGGSFSGTGNFQFTFGNFYARTNIDPRLKLIGGEIYITGTSTFQQGGVITNLTLDGANLHGTNRISGLLTVNSGNVQDYVTVLPTGHLLYNGSSQLYYTPLLVNLGTVTCNAGLSFCYSTPTVVSNGGIWNITMTSSDGGINSGGPGTGFFTNAGTVQKISSPGTTFSFTGYPFVNLPSGIIRAASGVLRIPGYTNVAGELQLAGGTFGSGFYNTNGMTGGTVDGAGTFGGAAAFDGGTVSPGGVGQALMQFSSYLVLGTNCTLSLDGTASTQGAYDQLSVYGGVTISNATLQVTSLPSVPVGTTFVIITNQSATPTVGNFNGLPENASLTISGQPFRIHYAGGDGNDVVLVRDSGSGLGPFISGGYSNKTFKLLGVGNVATIYTIQASTNLAQWANVGTATGDISGNFIFTDTNATNFRYRFYRSTN